MKCYVCTKKFKEGELVVPLLRYITNEKRGDFVTAQPEYYIHMGCVLK